uniref:Coiled-coil domain containing 125 n=1 Tax=Cyprinus carpio TaxID=7962 RepID=A0A8C2HGM3_CYPCA
MQGEGLCPQCPTEDDMREGDLGDGMGARSRGHHDHLPQMKSKGNNGPFSWTSCKAMYAVFREELEAERASSGPEVELLRTELEVTHRHLEGKHEALRILQGQAILDKATCHTKILLQKSEERNKALEKVPGSCNQSIKKKKKKVNAYSGPKTESSALTRKQGSLSVSERLKKFLPTTSEGKISADSNETLHMLLDLLNDKEEALAHQRKVSYMLARNTEDLEKRLQMHLEELGLSHKDSKTKTEAPEESEWSRGRDCGCSADSCGQHLSVPDSPAAHDEQSSEPNQPTTEIKETDNKDV